MPTAPLFVIHDNTYTGAWSCPIRPRSAGPATCRSAPVDQWELDGVPLHWGNRAPAAGLATAGVPEPAAVTICLL